MNIVSFAVLIVITISSTMLSMQSLSTPNNHAHVSEEQQTIHEGIFCRPLPRCFINPD